MDCLVTRLKGIASDGSLPKFNVFSINVEERPEYIIGTPVEENVSFKIGVIRPTTLKVSSGNGYFSVNSYTDVETDHLTVYELPADNTVTVYCKYGNYSLEVADASAVELFETGNYHHTSYTNSVPSCISPIFISAMPELTTVHCIYSNIGGTTDAFKTLSLENVMLIGAKNRSTLYDTIGGQKLYPKGSLTGEVKRLVSNATVGLYITACGRLSGGLENLGEATSLNNIFITSTGMSGNINDFISSQISHGRTQCTEGIFTHRLLTNFSFFGIKDNSTTYNNIFWDTEEKMWVSCIDGSSTAKPSKIYAHGCSEQEIAAWEQQGITVEVC